MPCDTVRLPREWGKWASASLWMDRASAAWQACDFGRYNCRAKKSMSLGEKSYRGWITSESPLIWEVATMNNSVFLVSARSPPLYHNSISQLNLHHLFLMIDFLGFWKVVLHLYSYLATGPNLLYLIVLSARDGFSCQAVNWVTSVTHGQDEEQKCIPLTLALWKVL